MTDNQASHGNTAIWCHVVRSLMSVLEISALPIYIENSQAMSNVLSIFYNSILQKKYDRWYAG